MVNRLAFLAVLLFLPFVIKAQGNREAVYHTVQECEWYSKIAPLYNTKVDSLEKWNPGVKSNNLQVGQKIIVGWKKVEVVKEQEHGSDSFGQGSGSGGTGSGGSGIGGTVGVGSGIGGTVGVDTGNGGTGRGRSGSGGTVGVGTGNGGTGRGRSGSGGTGSVGSKTYTWVWLLLGLLIGMILGAFLLYVLFVKKLRVELEHKENELSRVNYSLNSEKSSAGSELSRLHSRIKSLEQKNKDLYGENNSLRAEIAQIKAAQQRVNEYRAERTTPASTNQVSKETSETSRTLYADAIIDDCFVKVRENPNEDSIFILHLNGENSADFSIYDTARSKVVANPSYLDGCEKQVLCETNQIETVSKGKAQKEGDGKWKVINKLNVIIR